MNWGEMLSRFDQNYPVVYDCVCVLLAFVFCAVADFVVRKIILRRMKKIFCHLFNDSEGQSLVLKIASRLANVVPMMILF